MKLKLACLVKLQNPVYSPKVTPDNSVGFSLHSCNFPVIGLVSNRKCSFCHKTWPFHLAGRRYQWRATTETFSALAAALARLGPPWRNWGRRKAALRWDQVIVNWRCRKGKPAQKGKCSVLLRVEGVGGWGCRKSAPSRLPPPPYYGAVQCDCTLSVLSIFF